MKQKKPRKTHLIRRSIGLFFATLLLVFALVFTLMAPGMSAMLDSFAGGITSHATAEQIAQTTAKAEELAWQVQAESSVLLRNENKTLPLASGVKKVNVFGWASTDWLGGGSGSGGVKNITVDLLTALADYGIETNAALTKMYEDFQGGREYTRTLGSWPEQSCRMYEPSVSNTTYYSAQLLADAKAFSNTAIVVFGRISGESNDATQQQYKRLEKDGEIVVDESRTYLDLSTEEVELLTYVGANYENVIVILNTTNVMALGELETVPGVDACLMVGFTGQTSAAAIPALLWGEANPSGKTADTWAYDFATAASYANAAADGVGAYSGAEGMYPANGTSNGNLGTPFTYDQVSYLDYAEGIYIGYKWYETADAEGYWANVSNEYGAGYEGVVQYPFGYGLSYTEFQWEITDKPASMSKDGDLTVKVKVTNTGAVAGKDVVELYYTAPYTAGGIEKSAVELGAFAKTKLLAPGESQELELTLTVADMASYDCYDANANGFTGYELDAGEYVLSLRRDSHTVVETVVLNLSEGIQYAMDPITGLEVNNKFTGLDAMDGISLDGNDSNQNIVYLTRADFAGTFPKANVDSRPMADNLKALNLYSEEQANAWIDPSAKPITTGADNGLKVMEGGTLTELGKKLGSNYNDPQWEALLDQMTKEEMVELVTHGYGHTAGIESIGKDQTMDADGPAQIGGFTGSNPGTGFPSSSTLAQSWNKELALAEGRMIGHQAAQRGYSGWYAPAVNMHRSPFNGRNYEYYSEDAHLSGQICGNTVAGALDAGTFCYVKHFLCNDGESGIYRDGIYIWMTEQALREVYLEPFRIIVEEYGASGIMSSYNRVGAVWAGGSLGLLTGILRQEWNFQGAVITDYSDHHDFMNGDQMIRTGGDLWMDGMMLGTLKCETESNSFWQAMRQASKNIVYMTLNAHVENMNYVAESGDTDMTRPLITVEMPLWQKIIIGLDVVSVALFALALRSVILDVQVKRAAKKAKAQ